MTCQCAPYHGFMARGTCARLQASGRPWPAAAGARHLQGFLALMASSTCQITVPSILTLCRCGRLRTAGHIPGRVCLGLGIVLTSTNHASRGRAWKAASGIRGKPDRADETEPCRGRAMAVSFKFRAASRTVVPIAKYPRGPSPTRSRQP
jgi:hypothetical protein